VLSPLAAALVEWLPETLAPNSITLIGLAVPVCAYTIGHYYSPTFSCDEVPQWVYLLNAMSLLFYQTMDNMDGKQVAGSFTSTRSA